jgi:hypothetical protein
MNTSYANSTAPHIAFDVQSTRPTTSSAASAPSLSVSVMLEVAAATTSSATAEPDEERDIATTTVVDLIRLHTGRAIVVSEVVLPSGYTSAAISLSASNTDEIVIPLKLIPRIAHDLLAVYTRAHARPLVPRAPPADAAEPSPSPAKAAIPSEPAPPSTRAAAQLVPKPARIPPLSPVERRARDHIEVARLPRGSDVAAPTRRGKVDPSRLVPR